MSASVAFSVSIDEPHNHRIQVEMEIGGLGGDSELMLRMPVWTPGSYLIREYSKHVQRMEIRAASGEECGVEKIDKAGWRVDVEGVERVIASYEVYAHELSPRHNHVDGSHAFFNCVATCMYPEGRLDEKVELKVTPPRDDWQVFCGLEAEKKEGRTIRFRARDFDELFDTPVEMGPHQYFDFEVEGVFHRFVVWSDEEIDLAALRRDIPVVVEKNAEMFGGIPYDRYVFINHVARGKWGGLEHRHSSVNVFSPEHFDDTDPDEGEDFGDKYANILRLLSHEHFHAYHVKRLRPEELGPFDYQRENYTSQLWSVEGATSYFDTYQLCQSGLISPGRYMELLEKRITRLHEIPGRFEQSLEESSFDAWIRLYRRDEDTPNSTVSYYLKGEIVIWLLDLWIRSQTEGTKTMADVMRRMWNEYYVEGKRGYPRGAMEEAVAKESGADPKPVFDELVRGTAPIGWEEFLAPVGLRLCPESGDTDAWLGLKTKEKKSGGAEVIFVARGGPAEQVGLYAGDEIVALDGWDIRDTDVEELIGQRSPGEVVTFHVFRRQRLHTVELTCEEAPAESYRLQPIDDQTERQQKLLENWLGATEWNDN